MYAGVPCWATTSTTSHPPISRWPRSLVRVPSGKALPKAVAAIIVAIMEYASPLQPAETGRSNGIAWCLWLPDEAIRPDRGDPVPAVMILHGAGSRKENHADFARAATAYGFAALTFDNRGHGETEGDLGASVIDDLGGLARMLAERPDVNAERIGVRGSSMGGLMALHLGASSPSVHAVIAICPAAEWMIAEDVQRVADGKPPREGSAIREM